MGRGLRSVMASPPTDKPELTIMAEENAEFILVDAA
jgi:hypothetical protein